MTVLKTNVIQLKEVIGPEQRMAINPERVVLVEMDETDDVTIWFDCVVTLEGEKFIVLKENDFDDLVYRLTSPDGGWDSE